MQTNAIFVRDWNSHYHEECLPADAPTEKNETLDMHDHFLIDRMSHIVCSVCHTRLILGKGRIEQVLKRFPDFTMQSASHVEQFAEQVIGWMTTDKNGRQYKIIHTYIQRDVDDSSKGQIIALCEPLSNCGSCGKEHFNEDRELFLRSRGNITYSACSDECAEKITDDIMGKVYNKPQKPKQETIPADAGVAMASSVINLGEQNAALKKLLRDWQQWGKDGLDLESASHQYAHQEIYDELSAETDKLLK